MSEPARGRHAGGPDRAQVLRSVAAGAVAFLVLLGIVLVVRPEAVTKVIPFVGGDDEPAATSEPTRAGDGTVTLGQEGQGSADDVTVRGDRPTDPGTDGVLSATDLEPFALRGADLGFGWLTLDEAASATQTLVGTCLRKATSPGAAHVRLTSAFRQGSGGPVISATVRDFTLVPAAQRAFGRETTAVRTCVRNGSGPALELASADTGADATVALRFTVRRDGGEARGVLIAARVDQRTVTVIAVGATQDDLDKATDAARAVVQRMR